MNDVRPSVVVGSRHPDGATMQERWWWQPDEWLGQQLETSASVVVASDGAAGREHDEIGEFAYAKVPTHQTTDVADLASLGFVVVDTQLVFTLTPTILSDVAWNLVETKATDAAEPVEVSWADGVGDVEAVGRLAERSFRCSRFHLDPQIPDHHANRIKQAWAANLAAQRRGNGCLVARIDGGVVGFLGVVLVGSGDETTAVIDLIAVSPAYQGRQIGRLLVGRFAEWAIGQAAGKLVVGTQAANVMSVRFYESLGFRLSSSAYVLHRHANERSL